MRSRDIVRSFAKCCGQPRGFLFVHTTGFTERFRGSGESYKSSRRRYFRLRPARPNWMAGFFGTYCTPIPAPAGFLKLDKNLVFRTNFTCPLRWFGTGRPWF